MKAGWELKKLGEVCKTGSGGTPLKMHKDYYLGGKIPWLLSGEVSQGEIFVAKNFITENGLKNSSARLFPPNTVLIAMYGATAGQVGILRFEAATNQAVCGIFPNYTTIPEFLYYCFLSKKEELIAQAVGGAQPNISQIKIKNTLIPIPPLQEQQRIVSVLDEVFAAIDKAKANAERNFKNSKELFVSYLQGVFENKGDGWSTKQLKDVCRLITCGVAATPKYVDAKEGVPFLSAQNVKDGNVVLDKYRYISKQFHQELTKKNKPQKGDILYSRVGSKFGEAGVVEHDFEFSVYVSLTLIKPAVEILSSYYLKHFLNSRQIKDLALKSVSSSGVPNLNVKDVREFPIMLPSIFQQDKIVENIELLSLETKRLESIYQQKLTDLEELKKSILQKAFNGELNTADICA